MLLTQQSQGPECYLKKEASLLLRPCGVFHWSYRLHHNHEGGREEGLLRTQDDLEGSVRENLKQWRPGAVDP